MNLNGIGQQWQKMTTRRQRSAKKHHSVVANIVIWAMGIFLIGLTGWQTVDFLTWVLPSGQGLFVYAGLAAFDGGFVGWSFYFGKGVRNPTQRGIALIMIGLDFIGMAVCFFCNVMIGAQARGILTLDPRIPQAAVGIVTIVVLANVAALMACHLNNYDEDEDDDGDQGRYQAPYPTQIQQQQAQQSALPPAAAPSTPALPSPEQLVQLLQLMQQQQQLQQPRTSVQEVTGKLEAMPPPQTSPFPSAPLNSQTDQQSQNGKK
jgi:hypothetical protein